MVGCRLGLGARPWVHPVFKSPCEVARAIADLKDKYHEAIVQRVELVKAGR